MRKFEKKRSRRLRWHLLQPLAITFAFLWFGTMMIFTNNTCNDMETEIKISAQNAKNSMGEFYETYIKNSASERREETEHIFSNRLSSLSLGYVSSLDGGIALAAYTETGVVRSQLAWGYGNQEGTDLGQRWYFSFDEGLDDQGQINLAEWIMENRDSWSYSIYPKDEIESENSDGRFARVTGVERPGYEIAVQKIEIIHPDGSVDTMVETTTEGEGKTWDFAYIQVSSVLLPSWNSSGKDGSINMERRLSSFREAHAILDREIAGEQRSVLTKDGFLLGSTSSAGLVAVQCEVLPAALKEDLFLYVSTALLTLLVLSMLSAKLSKQVTLPVERLCREVTEGNCQTDTSIQELNTLAIAFRDAQQKMERQLEREREFTRSAAHELKTPLAILRAHAECIQEDIAPEKRASYLAVILEESDQMAGLVNQLLELARLESGRKLHMESVELDSLMKEVWGSLAPALEQKKIRLSISLEQVRINGDKDHLHKIVMNLASNALRYTPEGGAVQVFLHEEYGKVIIVVENDSQPIPEEDLPRLWEPFYRVDKSRNRSDGGTGLGLAIVSKAVQAHGGTCEVENRPGGVRFRITIPHDWNR